MRFAKALKRTRCARAFSERFVVTNTASDSQTAKHKERGNQNVRDLMKYTVLVGLVFSVLILLGWFSRYEYFAFQQGYLVRVNRFTGEVGFLVPAVSKAWRIIPN